MQKRSKFSQAKERKRRREWLEQIVSNKKEANNRHKYPISIYFSDRGRGRQTPSEILSGSNSGSKDQGFIFSIVE